MLQLNHYLMQESGSPRQAQRESCLPKGQAGIQVFFRVLVEGVHVHQAGLDGLAGHLYTETMICDLPKNIF